MASGTGFIGQYPAPIAQRFESLKTCPDELLLFFHHVPYRYVLHSGKTVIQHIYDAHYRGAAAAEEYPGRWETLQGRIDECRYQVVLHQLEYQAGHAVVWRDAVCQWFLKMSGIPDQYSRAGHYPNRIEAESMKLDGFQAIDVKPWETASGGKAVQCVSSNRLGSIRFQYQGKGGWFDLAVQYYDENDGVSEFTLFVNDQRVDRWRAAGDLPSDRPNGHTSTRRVVRGVALRSGDEVRIEARAGRGETPVWIMWNSIR